MNIALFGSVHK